MEMAQYSEKAFELIPAGMYTIRLDNIEITDKNPKYVVDGGDDKQWKWTFCVVGGEEGGVGKSLVAWCNRTINKGSTAKPWVEALLKRPLVDQETLNTDDILEQTMKVYIAEHTTEAGQVVNRIKDVPAQNGTAGTPAPTGADATVKNLREYSAARGVLLDMGVAKQALDTKTSKLLNGVDFRSATAADQTNVINVLSDWATDFEAYDPTGDLSF